MSGVVFQLQGYPSRPLESKRFWCCFQSFILRFRLLSGKNKLSILIQQANHQRHRQTTLCCDQGDSILFLYSIINGLYNKSYDIVCIRAQLSADAFISFYFLFYLANDGSHQCHICSNLCPFLTSAFLHRSVFNMVQLILDRPVSPDHPLYRCSGELIRFKCSYIDPMLIIE